MASSLADEPQPKPGEKRAPVAVEMGRKHMAVMLVQVFSLPIAFNPRIAFLLDAVRVRIFEIVPVRVQVFMGWG